MTESFSSELWVLISDVDLDELALAMQHTEVGCVVPVVQPHGVNWRVYLGELVADLPHSFLDSIVDDIDGNFFKDVKFNPERHKPRALL